ncbi:MAG: sulfatase-like hydrolase/transferase, partial [Acidimicrobiia bacterium]|nr:sulfatase-like hydrolase/transferase [Acidimicrobiia bacterium]
DRLDRHDLWADTAVILCTDHGHYLGEYGGCFGKPGRPVAPVLGHIPLLIAWPGVDATTCDALTTTVDIHATLADVFDVEVAHRTHGYSLRPLLEGAVGHVRDYVLQGYFARDLNVVDADGTYVRGMPSGRTPLSMWSNRWSTMPFHALPRMGLPKPDERAFLDRMPGSDIPVIRQPFTDADVGRHHILGFGDDASDNHLYDADDFDQSEDLVGATREAHYEDLLRHALAEVEAPDEHYQRLGLT